MEAISFQRCIGDMFLNIRMSVLLLFLAIAAYLWWWKRPHPKFPPGPRGLPFLGVIPFVGRRAELTFARWSQRRYGPVMSVRLGMKDCVLLSSYDVVQEAFVKQSRVFSGRQPLRAFMQSSGNYGVLFRSYSEAYKRQRNFGVQTLKKLGFGKKGAERFIADETEFLLEKMRKCGGSPLSMLPLLTRTTSNVISMIVLGRRFDGHEPEFQKLMEVLELLTDPFLNVLILFESSRYLPFLKAKNEKLKQQQNAMIDIFKQMVQDHKSTYKDGKVRDFIDAYIQEQNKTDNLHHNDSFSDEQLGVYVRDLFVAGTESISSTLAWALICLLHYPQYKRPVVGEIRSVFEKQEHPTLSRKDELPLTQAFLQEVIRFKLVTPLTHRQTTEDTFLRGYFIPKGTQVIANLHAVLNDPSLWPRPHVFDPKRHIGKDGRFVYSTKIIPFSVGGRYCIGESLARAEYLYFFASILLNFDIEAVAGEVPLLEGKLSTVVHLAPDFSIRVKNVRQGLTESTQTLSS